MANAPSVRTSKTTFIDGAYDAILKAIIAHELKPGDRLRSKELAEHLSISRTLVERALERLAGEGLVECKPGDGPYVVQPMVDNVLELYGAARGKRAERYVLVRARGSVAAVRDGVSALDR